MLAHILANIFRSSYPTSIINIPFCIARTSRGTPGCRNTPASNIHIIRFALNTDETETFHHRGFAGASTSHKGIKYSAARWSNKAAKVTHQLRGLYTWMIVTLTTVLSAGFRTIKEPTGAANFYLLRGIREHSKYCITAIMDKIGRPATIRASCL